MTTSYPGRHVFILDNGAHSIKAGWSQLNEPIVLDYDAWEREQAKKKAMKAKSKSTLTISGKGKRKGKGKDTSRGGHVNKDAQGFDEMEELDEEESLDAAVNKLYEAKIFPNSIARSKIDKRTYIGDELEQCTDFSELLYKRPFERGMLTAWDAEKVIWDRVFATKQVDPSDTSLLVTESYHNIPSIADTYDQMVFEEYQFASYYRCPAAALIPYSGLFVLDDAPEIPNPECMIVVDMGYSYTHVTPVINGRIQQSHCKRLDIGGKLLTNYLKTLVSFRQWDMMEETHVIDQVREDCCYVSLDWRKDMESCRLQTADKPILQEYKLPDFSPGNIRGRIIRGPNAHVESDNVAGLVGSGADVAINSAETEHQVLLMGNERFAVPEILFHPEDIGLHEIIAHVISAMPQELQGLFWSNIAVVGGLAWMENIGDRLDAELRALCPMGLEVALFESADPVTEAYYAAQTLSCQPDYLTTYPVTKKEYEEHGSYVCRRRFGSLHGQQYRDGQYRSLSRSRSSSPKRARTMLPSNGSEEMVEDL